MANRKIDAHRNGAFSMAVGNSEEGPIGEMFATSDAWYMTKAGAIYKIQLADHIDPDRENSSVPNVQQKAYDVGNSSEVVCRSLLTIRQLLSRERFGEEQNKAVMSIALRILDSLLVMQTILSKLEADEDRVWKDAAAQRRADGSVSIPAVGDIAGRVKSFIQNTEHCCQELYKLGCLFYDVEKNWADGLVISMRKKHADNDQFYWDKLEQLAGFLKFVRNSRHCIEHPQEGQRVVAQDFRFDKYAKIVVPSIEIIHSKTPEPEIPLRNFMRDMNHSILNVVESFAACIATLHLPTFAGFPTIVDQIPEERRRNKLVRMGYMIGINGEWHPLG